MSSHSPSHARRPPRTGSPVQERAAAGLQQRRNTAEKRKNETKIAESTGQYQGSHSRLQPSWLCQPTDIAAAARVGRNDLFHQLPRKPTCWSGLTKGIVQASTEATAARRTHVQHDVAPAANLHLLCAAAPLGAESECRAEGRGGGGKKGHLAGGCRGAAPLLICVLQPGAGRPVVLVPSSASRPPQPPRVRPRRLDNCRAVRALLPPAAAGCGALHRRGRQLEAARDRAGLRWRR